MVIIGVDTHPGTHTAVALDASGRELAYLTVENTEAGLQQLKDWAEQFPERVWDIEGASDIAPLCAMSFAKRIKQST